MAAFVLDCSVAVSWFMPDEAAHTKLLDRIAEQGVIVPALWYLEIGNVLLMAERRQRITAYQRQEALSLLKQLPISVDKLLPQQAWHETMNLACQHQLTLYDACYLELAQRLILPLATYDKNLIKAANNVSVTIVPA